MNIFKKTLGVAILSLGCSLCNLAHAGVIQIDTDKTSYQSGELITATLKANAFSEVLTGFFLALQYQPGQLVLQDFSFGGGFDDGFGSYQFSDHSGGRLILEEYADWAANLARLATQQPAGFVLASVRFKAAGTGLFSLNLDPVYLGLLTASGDLQAADWTGSNFSVTDTATVPAPAPLLLMCVALMALVRRRRV
ncbi:MAG: PEP-CTERM sorting domain-containing protein [Rheinheimera sp.]|nr:MAG: PEP-CTERM sorting domain-containing protein [Rheinheimera sp.]